MSPAASFTWWASTFLYADGAAPSVVMGLASGAAPGANGAVDIDIASVRASAGNRPE
jgi:hypothetical protein